MYVVSLFVNLGFWELLRIVALVFQAVALFSIARKRWQISCPGLAFLPIGNAWVLGSLSDDYQKRIRKKICHKRRILPSLEAATLLVAIFGETLLESLPMNLSGNTEYAIMGPVLLTLELAWLVYRFRCLYDVYESCNPDTSVAFLIWSVVIEYLIPIFLWIDRKKSIGMREKKPMFEDSDEAQEDPAPQWEEDSTPQSGGEKEPEKEEGTDVSCG